jgi:hypothetical protein
MRKNIRIENPVSGCGFTSKNRANRFVAQGRAEWVQAGVSIRFVQSDHRHSSAQKSVNQTNLPMIAPGVALGIGRRKGATRHTFLATQGF